MSGYKSEWRGLVEMQEGCTFEIEDGYYIAPAVDATDKLGDEEALKALMAGRVIFKGLTIAPSTIDGEEGEYAFLYNWNGSGMEGSNSDLYFNASLNGQVYTFTVESDEVPEGSDTYTAVTRLNIGDTVDIEGFLYWYNTAETHVHEITVK